MILHSMLKAAPNETSLFDKISLRLKPYLVAGAPTPHVENYTYLWKWCDAISVAHGGRVKC